MFKHKSTSGSNCFVTFILPEGALFVYQLFAEQSIILNLKQKRNPVSTEFLFCYLTEFCPSLIKKPLYYTGALLILLYPATIPGCFSSFTNTNHIRCKTHIYTSRLSSVINRIK